MIKQNNKNIFIQTGRFINVINSSYRAQAAIYDESEREQISLLIHHNFLPHHTAIAYREKSSKNHWRLEQYRGSMGVGFKLITTSYVSRNARHVTYFLKDGVMNRPVKKVKHPAKRKVLGNPNLTDEEFAIIDDKLHWRTFMNQVHWLLRKHKWIEENYLPGSQPPEEFIHLFWKLDCILQSGSKCVASSYC